MALPYELSLQLEVRQGLEVGPRVAKRREEGEKSKGGKALGIVDSSLFDG